MTFTLADLERIVAERAGAAASPDEPWTAKLIAAESERVAKKLGEEAVETVIAAVAQDRGGARRGERRPDLSSARFASRAARRCRTCWTNSPGGPRSPAWPRKPRARRGDGAGRKSRSHGSARFHEQRRKPVALPRLLPRRLGEAARRHADDADGAGDHPAPVAERSDLSGRGRGDLSADVAPSRALCRGHAGAVQGDAALPLCGEEAKVPYIIGLAGSVAVGKSTTARVLQALLARWPNTPKVDLVTTDGFPAAKAMKRSSPPLAAKWGKKPASSFPASAFTIGH